MSMEMSGGGGGGFVNMGAAPKPGYNRGQLFAAAAVALAWGIMVGYVVKGAHTRPKSRAQSNENCTGLAQIVSQL
jgi:hypothetical protein